MNIAIIGYGRMGKMIERTAREEGHRIVTVVDPLLPDSAAPAGSRAFKTVEEAENLNEADAAVEFTRPGTAVANIMALVKRKIPLVVGTTGWYDKMTVVKEAVEAAGTSLVWSSNFSLGVNVFYRIAWYASRLADSFPEYDIGGYELHHNKKMDSPSGTAKTLVEGVLSRTGRKKRAVWDILERQPAADELHYPSLRIGAAPGTHTLILDSPADTIEITHRARNREGFASGAIRAALWLIDPGTKGPRRGVFTLDEMLGEILGV
ncbi:MAG: 4-hydroxy-tetrahydrodipicolinate reductase [Treponema sp.]|jgi:4-hydroxy-tetrahydrodipicolinate reductase|nr:4-hydroxy-tetrahydrodipicolinate reductase [Treponema sp.]